MFHRHEDAGDGHAGQSLFGHRDWEKVTGHVVDIRLLHTHRPPPHAKIFDVRLHPKGREPVMAEVHLSPHDRIWDDVFQPSKGDVRGFLFDPASGKTQFDMTDGRNSWKAQNAKMEALKERMLEDEPADDDSVTGPPWVVPAHCPTCGAAVNRAKASMDLEPQCGYCHQPLPVQPRARF